LSIDDEEDRISLFFGFVVITLSDEIAIGLSPKILSINHLCGLEIRVVELLLSSVRSEYPSEESCFCKRANIMSETVAANNPVGQSIKTAMIKGSIKKTALPSALSRNSRDFRGAISTKEPITTRPTTDRIPRGECKTECVFLIQDIMLKSISVLLFAGLLAFGEPSLLAFGDEASLLAFGDEASLLAFGDEASLLTFGDEASLLAFGDPSLRTILLEEQSFNQIKRHRLNLDGVRLYRGCISTGGEIQRKTAS